MASKETKSRIIVNALDLFNRYGSPNISTNRIAAQSGISKGNLNYHYSKKSEIILDIFSEMRDEIIIEWKDDHLNPTLEHIEFMFLRQLHMIWRYRFFYREIVNLLKDDPILRHRFNDLRIKRRESLKAFLVSLVDNGHMILPRKDAHLEHLITSTWVLSENWINYVDTLQETPDEQDLQGGYDVLMSIFRPYIRDRSLTLVRACG